MQKMVLSMLILAGLSLPFLSNAASPGYVGENMGIDFYSRIDENTESTIESLRSNHLRDYGTFAGFGKDCRSGAPWLDTEQINEQILIDATRGNYSGILAIAERKGVRMTSESLTRLTTCLAQTYREMYQSAQTQENALMTLGNMGLYTDGDTKNSDYDIISDIEKINTILFAKRIDYTGTKNIGKISLANLLAGRGSSSLFGNSTNTTTFPGTGSTQSGGTYSASGATGSSSSTGSSIILTIGSVCQRDGSITDTAVGAIVDEDFLRDLENTLRGYGNNGNNGGTSYAPSGTPTTQNPTSTSTTNGGKEKEDFFNTPRCDGIFCIKVKTQTATQNLLGGGKSYSIESLLDKHTKIAEPISLSDLSQQKMTNNSFQLPFVNVKLRDKVSGGRTYLSSSPQPKDTYKKEETEADKNAEYEILRRCAYEKAGLSADKKEANSILGAGYALRRSTTTETAENTVRELGPTTVNSLGGVCYETAAEEGRSIYYQTFSTDLSDIEAFTLALINQIDTLLKAGGKLDKLPIK